MKIAVLGGLGLMAEAALHDLAASPKVSSVEAVDLNLARAKTVLAKIPQRRKIRARALDFTQTAAAARALKGTEVVLNAAWYEHNLKGMELALALGAHYVDLGGLYHMTLRQLKLGGRFVKAGRLAVLGCGSTPGVTNLMVARMAESFETLSTVGIYDAGYDPSISQDYFLPPFSIRTMLAEYQLAAPVLRDGRIAEVPAHSAPETLDFKPPIGRVELGTVIHSEVATLPAYLKDKGVRNLFFKIAYHPAVKSQLALLVGMGLSKDEPIQVNGCRVSPRRFVTALAQNSAVAAAGAETPRDFEILRVHVEGARHGKRLAKTWDCELRPTRHLSAGAMGVGWPASIAALMLAGGHVLRKAGVGAPESVLEHDRFFRELKSRRTFTLVETIAHPLTL